MKNLIKRLKAQSRIRRYKDEKKNIPLYCGHPTAFMFAATLTGCRSGKTSEIRYHFADRREAISCYLSNEDYLNGFSPCDIQYRMQNKDSTIEDVKEFGVSQMAEFTDEEKTALEKVLEEMQRRIRDKGYSLPELEEITFVRSTTKEECYSTSYTHGTSIFMGDDMFGLLCSDDEEDRLSGQYILWHELFHCLTRINPNFRSDMYSIIHFTVQDQEYSIPPSVFEMYISNPDVEHHNAYATFKINGEDIDCFAVFVAGEPFEQEGDNFFDCMETVLVPIDGSGIYYKQEDAENFWDIFGSNTDYVVDPEECMADNFGYALTYGFDDMEYENPEIIEKILAYLMSAHQS